MRRWIVFVGLLVLFGGLIGFNLVLKPIFIAQKIRGDGPPVATVSAVAAELRSWQPQLTAVGTIEAVQGAMLSVRESGIVKDINFESGQRVNAGDLLVQIDDEEQRADIALFEATLRNAQVELSRTQSLVKSQAVSKAALDRVRAARDEALAQLNRAKARAEDQALRAPFTGRLGIRQVNVGQFVNPGDPIVSLQTLDPIFVTFELPENVLGQIETGRQAYVTVDAYPGKRFTGEVTSIDVTVDSNTRSISIQATLANPDNLLTPGMFANVHVLQPVVADVVTVPQTAISYSLYGDTVWVLSPEGDSEGFYVPQRRIIETRDADEGDVAVNDVIAPGELVVTAGQHKIRPGWKIRVSNEIQLANKDALPRQ